MSKEIIKVEDIIQNAIIYLMILAFFIPLQPISAISISANNAKDTSLPEYSSQETSMYLPHWEPPLDESYPDNAPVVYEKEEESVQGRFPSCENCPPESTEYCKPDLPPDTPAPPIMWPDSPTVKVIAFWPSGETSPCSGVLIQPNYILTAAHCVYTHHGERCNNDDSCWVDNLQIYSNYGHPVQEKTNFTKFFSWTTWTANRDFNYDLAAVELKDHIGEESRGVGWLGFGFNNDVEKTFLPNEIFIHSSLPHTSEYDGKALVKWVGHLQVSENQEHLLHSADRSVKGQSGAALRSPGANHVVYGVLSQLLEDGTQTGYTQITYDKFSAIRDWITGGIKTAQFLSLCSFDNQLKSCYAPINYKPL